MSYISSKLVFAPAVIFFLLLVPAESFASLNASVKKYKNSIVSRNNILKISKYDELIRYFCSFSYFVPHHKVSTDFIRALILAESNADHRAVSKKNAIGLGQILLSTGQQAGRELAESRTEFNYVSKATLLNITKEDLFDPAVNILLTCYLIAKYNYKFNGQLHLVVSAWNAGENTESLRFGQHAPYAETEDLIGKVNSYYVYLLNNRIFQ